MIKFKVQTLDEKVWFNHDIMHFMAIYQERRKWTNYAKENTYILFFFFQKKKEPYFNDILSSIKFDILLI